jgi:hypothetical protein
MTKEAAAMMSKEERRDEFDAMPDAYLLKLLRERNPFGGYSIGKKEGQLTREQVIQTLLRYEGYK